MIQCRGPHTTQLGTQAHENQPQILAFLVAGSGLPAGDRVARRAESGSVTVRVAGDILGRPPCEHCFCDLVALGDVWLDGTGLQLRRVPPRFRWTEAVAADWLDYWGRAFLACGCVWIY